MTTTALAPGWPADAAAFLAELAADNTKPFWAANKHRYVASVLAPMEALGAALAAEFGPLRIQRPYVDRRFQPTADPYRTEIGGSVLSPGGTRLGVLFTAAGLSALVGHYRFDRGQLARYREAAAGSPGAQLVGVLAELAARHDLGAQSLHQLTGLPRGVPATHPRLDLLRRKSLHVGRTWRAEPWQATPEVLDRVVEVWRAAAPLVGWLDIHVGPAAERGR